MRIEIIGLPGVGKTTLAEALCANKLFAHEKLWMTMDDVLLSWYKSQPNDKKMLLVDFLARLTCPPVIKRQMKMKMLRKSRSCAYKKLYHLEDHFNHCGEIFIDAISKGDGTPLEKVPVVRNIERAIIVSRLSEQFFNNKIAIFDEGFGMRLITLARFNVPMNYIEEYCDFFPAPDGYVLMALHDKTERNTRLIERKEEDFTRRNFNRHAEKMEKGVNILIDKFDEKNVQGLCLDAQNSIEENIGRVKRFVHQLC